jgi:hypothetical protein
MSRFCQTDLNDDGVPLEAMEAAEDQDDADLWLSRLVADFK